MIGRTLPVRAASVDAVGTTAKASPGTTGSIPAGSGASEVRLVTRDPATTDRTAELIANGYSVAECTPDDVLVVREPARILYLAPWLTIGGSDKGTVDWFRQITTQMFRRYLMTTVVSDNALFPEGAALADEAWCLPEMVSRQQMPELIMEFIATRGVDIVHVMNSRLGFDLIPTIKAAFPGVLVVVQLHAEEQDQSGYTRYVASRYDNLIDAYSVVSEDMRERLGNHHVSPSKVHVIYLGVDATSEYDPGRTDRRLVELPPGRFNVLFPARLTSQKDPELALEVIAALRERVPETAFHVVGGGDLLQRLVERVAQMGLRETVTFHGPSKDMWGWYRSADAVLMTSRFEGVPLVVYEAMSMGVPVVASDTGATGEILDNDVGCLVPQGSEVSVFVDALAGLAKDPGRRDELGRKARERVVANYTVEEMGIQHRRLYGRLLSSSALGAVKR